MATVLVPIPVYKINSTYIPNAPFGQVMYFAGATLQVQANTGDTVGKLTGGTRALLYSAIRSSATGNTIFYSNLTAAAIQTLTNA